MARPLKLVNVRHRSLSKLGQRRAGGGALLGAAARRGLLELFRLGRSGQVAFFDFEQFG